MSQRALQPQLFHGTTSDIKDAVVPATVHRKGSHWAETLSGGRQDPAQHAFASSEENTAWHFANHAYRTAGGGRTRVYEVAPHPDMKPGAYHDDLKEYIAPKFPVKQRLDIKPGHQGTFPQVDWNRHQDWENAPWGSTIDPDANHPAPPMHTRTPELHAEHVAKQQDQAHAKFAQRQVSLGQAELFDRPDVVAAAHHSDYARARHHDVRHLIAEGKAPSVGVDHEMAQAEADDSWNRRKGRRSNAAGRLREKREWGG